MGEVVVVNCIEARELFSPFLDHELIREEELRLQAHLESCSSCCQEMAEWQRFSKILQGFREQDLNAPPGFANTVMERINLEKTVSTRTVWRRWKQAAIGIAAALLLAFGSLAIKPDVVKIAETPNPVETPVEINSQNYPDNNSNLSSQDSQSKDTPQTATSDGNDIAAPEKSNGTEKITTRVNLTGNQDHTVVSTFIKIKVADTQKAESKASALARSYGAAIQSLGQQSEGETNYQVDKITTDSSATAQILISELRSLGILTSEDSQEVNLDRRYSEVKQQLIDLMNQRAATQDSNLILQLDKQIDRLEEQLLTWDKQSQERTIVLWLQQQ